MTQRANPLINIPATKVFVDTWDAIVSRRYKLICQEGSSRSSKTWSDFLVWFKYNYENANKVTTILRDTATDCRDIVETEFIKWMSDPCNRTAQFEDGVINVQELNKFLIIENLKNFFVRDKTKHTWTFKHNGSTIRFTGLDDEDKVMGMTQNVAQINEPYNFPHEVYKQLSQRTSDFIIVDWNPKKKHWVDQEKAREDSIVLRSTFRDNPFCPDKQKKQLLSYQPLSHCEVVERGLITERDALVYQIADNKLEFSLKQIEELSRCVLNESQFTASKYHWEVYGLGLHSEIPNRIFKWSPISISEFHDLRVPSYYYSDWGAVDPWAIGEVKYYDGALYVRELNYASENEIRAKLTPTELAQINGTGEEGIITWMFNRLGVDKESYVICDTNRPNKIIALRNGGWDYAGGISREDVGASKSEVVDGIDLLNNLRVYYTSDSKNLEYEQENYSRKVDRYGIVLEEPEDRNNHCIDGIRYVALFLQAQGVINKL